MTKKKSTTGIDVTYTTKIEPLITKLKIACKAHNMPALIAVDVPLTQNAGVCMLTIVPNKDGQVSTGMKAAYDLLQGDARPATV
jgi:hypothetical protein